MISKEKSNVQSNQENEVFEQNKRRYFIRLGLGQTAAFRMHRDAGLWERTPEGKRDWGNVSEHCLVEMARTRAFSELLDLPQDLQKDLETAAALHDYFKKGEKEVAARYDFSWEGFDKASEISSRQMHEAGFSERVVKLANSVGHGSLEDVEGILSKHGSLDNDDLAYLTMHYIDDYTIGSDWVADNEDPTEAFEARMKKNEANPRYARLNEEGRERFDGRTTFEAMREVGSAVQEQLSQEIAARTGAHIEPTLLPVRADEIIRGRINQVR